MSGTNKKGGSGSHPHQQRRKKGDSNFNKGGEFGKRQKPDTKPASGKNQGSDNASALSPQLNTRTHKQDNHPHELEERLNYIVLNLVGQKVNVQVRDGSIYEGIFHSATPEKGFGVILRMARKLEKDVDVQTTLPIQSVTISAQDFVQINAPEVTFVEDMGGRKKRGGGFITDSEISQEGYRMRELTPWMPEPGQDLSLDELEGPEGSWDQFATNQKLFGVQSTYDEDIYTTPLDRSSSFYRQHHAKAQRLATEIVKKTSANPHLAEERGHQLGVDFEDEEDRYSTVIRDQPPPPAASRKTDKSADKERAATAAAGTYQIPAKRGGRTQPRPHLQQQPTAKPDKKERQENGDAHDEKKSPLPAESPKEQKESEQLVPKLEKLENPLLARQSIGLRPRSFSAGNIADVFPRSVNRDALYAERLRIQKVVLEDDRDGVSRKQLLRERGEKKNPREKTSPRSPLLSPLVGHPDDLHALNLLPATPVIKESVQKQFSEFKQEKQKRMASELTSVRDQRLIEFKSFSRELDRRSSAPNSPVARRRHTILSATVSYKYELESKQQDEANSPDSSSPSLQPQSAETTPSVSPALVTTPAPEPTAVATTSPTAAAAPEAAAAAPLAVTTPAPTASATTTSAPAASTAEASTATTTTTTATPSADAKSEGTTTSELNEDGTPVAPPAKSLSKLNPFAKAWTPKATPKLQELPPPPGPDNVYMEQPMMGQEMPYEVYDARYDPQAEMMGYPPYGGGVYYVEEEAMHYGNPMGPPPRGPMPPYGVPYIPSPTPQQLPSPPVNMFPPQHGYIPGQGPQVGYGGPYPGPPPAGPAPQGPPYPHMYPGPPTGGGMPPAPHPQHGKRMPPMGFPPGPQGYPGQFSAGAPGPALSPPPMRHHSLTPPTSGGMPLSSSPPHLSPLQGGPTSPPASPSMMPQGPYGGSPGQKPSYAMAPLYDSPPPVYPGVQDPQQQGGAPGGGGRGGVPSPYVGGGYQPGGAPPVVGQQPRYGGGGGRGGAPFPPAGQQPPPVMHDQHGYHGGNRGAGYFKVPNTDVLPQTKN